MHRNVVFKVFINLFKMMQFLSRHNIFTMGCLSFVSLQFIGIIVLLVSFFHCQSDRMGTDQEGCDHHTNGGQ